ncbi:MAG TPA: ABC-type transport auxiliary lipoprotein family protein [Rhodanobacteraceae bacterium]|nr:ABC-type transport auxiliary lipoprotein family protein [Rhodanobacteraceae bacterium]
MMKPPSLALCSLAATALLAGCAGGPKPVFPHHYTLAGPAGAGAETHAASPAAAGAILQITRISVPQWLQGTALYYRLDYRHDGRVSAYARSDWVAPPASLLERVIQHQLAAAGAWRAVLEPGSAAIADYDLQIQLNDFSQSFDGPSTSSGVLDAVATLVDNHDGGVAAQKHFHLEARAPSADAAGGVKALSDASHRFAAQLQAWLQSRMQ